MFKRLNFQQGKDMKSTGIDKLEVPRSWPSLDKYDENTDYTLQDPTVIQDDDKWMTVTCPKAIKYYLKL